MRKKIIYRESLKHFTLRGESTQRLDAISDGVFALAVAMLLLSSSVPQHFEELFVFLYDAVPFFVCMLVLCFSPQILDELDVEVLCLCHWLGGN